MKREIFTDKEIERDLKTALKYPPASSKATYIKICITAALAASLVVLTELLLFLFGKAEASQNLEIIVFSALFILAIGNLIFWSIRHSYQTRKISLDSYRVTTQTVLKRDEEHYLASKYKSYYRTVSIYSIQFENGKVLRLPQENFLWSKEYPLSDFGLYEVTQPGDRFTVVEEKKTGNIVLAYPNEYFQYEGNRNPSEYF